jgi:hypothetical protein
MSVVVNFRKEDISPEDVLRYFFREINESYKLDISLTDPRIKSHIPALKSLANVYIHTANPHFQGIPDNLCEPVSRELNHLRARFLAETVLGILVNEGIVRLKA